MSEIKSFYGNPLCDSKAREEIELLRKNTTSGSNSSESLYSEAEFSGTTWKTINRTFPKGVYKISFDSISSSDETVDYCRIYFGGESTRNPYVDVPRGENVSVEICVLNDYTNLYVFASNSYANSNGKTLAYTNLSVVKEPDYVMKSYPFWGKKFAIIGDSFSQSVLWATTMCNELKSTLVSNKAQGGAKFASVEETIGRDCAYGQALAMVEDGVNPDYIYVFLGTNDQGNNIPIGEFVDSTEISDFDLSTYCGGMQACLNYLQNNYPEAVIRIGFTPNGGDFASGDIAPYLDAMKEIAKRYAVSYMDTLSCGFSCYSAIYADYWERGIIEKGFHPSQKGYIAIGKAIARKTLHGG